MSRRTAERIQVDEAAAILGLSPRGVQAMAARGELPSAAKINARWTFNEAALRRHVRELEDSQCQKGKRPKAAIGGARRFTGEPRSLGENTAGAFEQMMSNLLQGGARPKQPA